MPNIEYGLFYFLGDDYILTTRNMVLHAFFFVEETVLFTRGDHYFLLKGLFDNSLIAMVDTYISLCFLILCMKLRGERQWN